MKRNGFEEAMNHARKIQKIQQEKRARGIEPVFSGRSESDPTLRNFRRLEKNLIKERRNEIKAHPTRKLVDMGERHRHPIKCVDTGEIFHSVNEAARWLGLSPATVSIQITRKRKLRGHTLIRISKEDEYKENQKRE